MIGASAGGIQALERLVLALPADLEASVFVTLHVADGSHSVLPSILARAGSLPARHAVDGEAIVRGCILVAPPGAHLMLERGRMRLGLGPLENGSRPAIDPLFRSAAHAFRRRVVGVVLSGTLDDGTAGLWSIKRHGGLAIVQDPADALHAGMPRSALEYVQVDHVLPALEIGRLLASLVHERIADAPERLAPTDEALAREVALAATPMQGNPLELPYGPGARPAALSCPSCQGSLWEIQDGALARFRCQVGHAYSVASLLAAQDRKLEDTLWAACRALEESAALSQRMAERAAQGQHQLVRQRFEAKARLATERAELLRRALLSQSSEPEPAGEPAPVTDEKPRGEG